MLVINFIRVLHAMIHLKFYKILDAELNLLKKFKLDTFLEENCTKRERYRALSAEEQLFLALIRDDTSFQSNI